MTDDVHLDGTAARYEGSPLSPDDVVVTGEVKDVELVSDRRVVAGDHPDRVAVFTVAAPVRLLDGDHLDADEVHLRFSPPDGESEHADEDGGQA